MKTIISEVKTSSDSLPKSNESLLRAFDLCVQKTRRNIKRLADAPKSWSNAPDGRYETYDEDFFDIGNWTSSFFTGMALLAWQQTRDEFFLEQVLRLAPLYREKVFTRFPDTHHDLGFLYTLYSVALFKLTGDREHHAVGLRAAEVLSQRFNGNGNFIRAWGHLNTTEHNNMAIIDCLMNLPLLFWAAQESGEGKYRDIAIKHANMALEYLVRPDHSVYHAYRFDLTTGRPLGGDTYGGWAVESHWARGAAWAIYGFALAHKYTKAQRYLDGAERIAQKFIASLDAEVVPVWDFKLPPGSEPIRDSSAAAIAACGLKELAVQGAQTSEFMRMAGRLLSRLCQPDYLDFDPACPGILRNGQVGDGRGMAKNAYTSWGDYYLMEALGRELFGMETWW
ncbi:MAG TPA: glycoside hydrolase family 88 protein [Verrucomicrobiae bacterium]|nr:glycoside hydrolase family 88 protein [Verrucomicrobiae bacterium]